MGLCHETRGSWPFVLQGAELPGPWMESCPAQRDPPLLVPRPATPPQAGGLYELPAQGPSSPHQQGDAYLESRVTAQCHPQPQDPDRQTPSFGQG